MECEPKFHIHQASHNYLNEPIYFQVVDMSGSTFVWVGRRSARLTDLSIAGLANDSKSTPSVTTILGKDVSEQSRNLARRLTIKYQRQFFVSLDIGNTDDMLTVFVEKHLSAMLKTVGY